MNFDTNERTSGQAAVSATQLMASALLQGSGGARNRNRKTSTYSDASSLGDVTTDRVDKSDDMLLARLDSLFGPMLEDSRAGTSVVSDGARNAPPPMSLQQELEAQLQAERTEALSALDAYRRELDDMGRELTSVMQIGVHRPEVITTASGRQMVKPKVGLGPRLYIGFDCEWTYSRRGHNRIDTTQFVTYGPTGESSEHLFDLSGDNDIDQRLRLSDALDVVLDKAEKACVFEHWPHEVVLVGFFLRGDLTAFADFKDLRPQLDGLAGSLGTVGKAAKLTLPMDEQRQARLKSRYRQVLGDDFEPRVLNVRIIDASSLGPPGVSLHKIGEWLEQPKVKLPEGYSKSDMRKFKREQQEQFSEYALHDARLAVLYVLWVLWFSDRHLGIKGLSSTVSSLAVRLAEACMREDGVHPDVALNYVKTRSVGWDSLRHRPVTRTERVPSDIRRWLEPFLADAYIGGRNEAFTFGPSEVRPWFDSDLAGAYLTGLAVFMALDYERMLWTKDLQAFIGPVAGFAQVRFRFPVDTAYPCLPVALDTGLCFPKSGVSLCTAPEIELALAMGAQLEVIIGLVIPFKPRAQVFAESEPLLKRWRTKKAKDASQAPAELPMLQGDSEDGDVQLPTDAMTFPPPALGDEGYRPMESFAIYVRKMRQKFKRKTLPFEFCKLVGNGLYGKTGQGYKGKRAFGPKELRGVPIGLSRVSEAAVAALVCGFVRATLGEILWKLPPSAKALSVTTDGALMSVPTDQLDLTGAICRRYQALVDRVAPGTSMVEAKHRVLQVFIPRTRGCFTIQRDGDHPAICAKAGHQVTIPEDAREDEVKHLHSAEGASDWMIRLALDRQPGQRLPQDSFDSLRDQLINGWDLQKRAREVAVALEYDFKRRPVNPRMVRLEPYDSEHLAFDTVPWDTVEDAIVVREVFRRWKKDNCLKTMEDWHTWQAAMVTSLGNRRRRLWQPGEGEAAAPEAQRLRGGTGQKHLRGGENAPLRLVVRTFLAVFTQGLWGLAGEKEAWSYKELAKWLSGLGYRVTESDIKNAKRSRVDEGIAADTPEIRKFLDTMQQRFARLEMNRFFTS